MMNIAREFQVQGAVESMRKLGIFTYYVEEFENDGQVLIYEDFMGYQIEDPKILEKIKEIEMEGNCVYAVTHDYTSFGELYNFLIVTKYPEEWDDYIRDIGTSVKTAYAYVWNKSDESRSEYGRIAIQSFGGGIKRIG